MNELARALIGSSAFAPAKNILQAIPEPAAHRETICRRLGAAPRSIYEEVWHMAFWQEISLDWVQGKPTPYPLHASEGFPTDSDGAMGRSARPLSLRNPELRSHRQRHRAARNARRLPYQSRTQPPHGHDRSRAIGEPRRPQWLPPGTHRAPASVTRHLAPTRRRRLLVVTNAERTQAREVRRQASARL